MIEINLLPEELKVQPKTKKMGPGIDTRYFLYLIPLALGLLLFVHISLGALYLTKKTQLSILNKKMLGLGPQRQTLEGFKKEFAVMSEDAKAIQRLTEERIIWAKKLNKLSLYLPSGIWFNSISVARAEFTLAGSVVSLDKEEMSLIKKLMDNLKNDKDFFKDFQTLELNSVQKRTIESYDIADFTLVGELRK